MAYSLTFVISVVIVPEITIPGFEGLIYGAITTYSNQSQNVANAINNLLLAAWPSNGDDAALRSCAPPADADADADAGGDDATCAAVRWHMLLLTLLSVGIASCSLLFLPLLPRQKCHVAEDRHEHARAEQQHPDSDRGPVDAAADGRAAERVFWEDILLPCRREAAELLRLRDDHVVWVERRALRDVPEEAPALLHLELVERGAEQRGVLALPPVQRRVRHAAQADAVFHRHRGARVGLWGQPGGTASCRLRTRANS